MRKGEEEWQIIMEQWYELVMAALQRIPVITYPQMMKMLGDDGKSTALYDRLRRWVDEMPEFREEELSEGHRRDNPYWELRMNQTKYVVKLSEEKVRIDKRDVAKYLVYQEMQTFITQCMGIDWPYWISTKEKQMGAQAALQFGSKRLNVFIVPFQGKRIYSSLSGYMYRLKKLENEQDVIALVRKRDYFGVLKNAMSYVKESESVQGKVYIWPYEEVMLNPIYYFSYLLDRKYREEMLQWAVLSQLKADIFGMLQETDTQRIKFHMVHLMIKGHRGHMVEIWDGDVKRLKQWKKNFEYEQVNFTRNNTTYRAQGWFLGLDFIMTGSAQLIMKNTFFNQFDTIDRMRCPLIEKSNSPFVPQHELTQEEMDALFDEDDTTIPDDENPFLMD